jgi:hypothetical protein
MRFADRPGWRLPEMPELHALGTDPIARGLVSRGILYPCQAIFFSPSLPVQPFRIVEDRGIVVRDGITRTEYAMLAGLMQVVQRIDGSAPVRYLTDAEVADALSADAHRYRALMETTSGVASGVA